MELRIGAIAARDTAKHQDRLADPSLLTTDTAAVVADPEVDIVVELIGGTDPALTLVRTALENGKPVITGNKELLAAHGPELYAVAAEHGVDLREPEEADSQAHAITSPARQAMCNGAPPPDRACRICALGLAPRRSNALTTFRSPVPTA